MTFWIILAVAFSLTVISLWKYELLFFFGASLGWFALWIYNLQNPPSGVTIGSNLHNFLIFTFIVMAIAVMFSYFKRGKIAGSANGSEVEMSNSSLPNDGKKGLMEMNGEEYRDYMHNKIRNHRKVSR